MPKDIPSQYIAKDHEDFIYKMWEEGEYFKLNITNLYIHTNNYILEYEN